MINLSYSFTIAYNYFISSLEKKCMDSQNQSEDALELMSITVLKDFELFSIDSRNCQKDMLLPTVYFHLESNYLTLIIPGIFLL